MFKRNRIIKTIHGWFGLSYASWLTMPRVLMQQMPPKWQEKMVDLLDEFNNEFPEWAKDVDQVHVTARKGGKFSKIPEWLNDYRHPDKIKILMARGKKSENS